MKKLTIQIAAAYMGAQFKYIGQRAWNTPSGDLIHTLVGVDAEKGMLNMEYIPTKACMWYDLGKHQLMLYSLADITDEDIFHLFDWIRCKKDVEFTIRNFSMDSYSFSFTYTNSKGEKAAGHGSASGSTLPLSTWDYLRSKSYDVGFMDIPSLIEARIATKISK